MPVFLLGHKAGYENKIIQISYTYLFMKRVYTFGNGKAEGRADMKNPAGR